MAKKVFQYFQPNEKDIKDRYGDCVIRALCKFFDKSWVEIFKDMIPTCLKVQSVPSSKSCYEEYLKRNNAVYTGISNKKGSKRPTVRTFAMSHKEGRYFLNLANHCVTVVDGVYYDTWDCGEKCLYGYWTLDKRADIVDSMCYDSSKIMLMWSDRLVRCSGCVKKIMKPRNIVRNVLDYTCLVTNERCIDMEECLYKNNMPEIKVGDVLSYEDGSKQSEIGLENILSIIDELNKSGKTSGCLDSYVMFDKSIINSLKEYGFRVAVTQNKKSGKYCMNIYWNIRSADNEKKG